MKEKILYWIPRVLTILAILFMMIFSFDVFEGNEPLFRKLLGFLMHNIPVFILTAILIISWRWEIIGGVVFILSAIAGSTIFFAHTHKAGSIIIMIPFLIVGILFILHHILYAKSNMSNA